MGGRNVFFIFLYSSMVYAAPVVQKIVNDTDFGFLIKYHDDNSECTLHNKCRVIEPRSIFHHEFLLDINTKGLVLRPVFYKDHKTNKTFWLTDQKEYEYNDELIEKAYKDWYQYKFTKKYKNDYLLWMRNWVGSDISLNFDPVEIFGYLIYWSRVRISNMNSDHKEWLSFAKGIFSKLMLELKLSQSSRSGIFGKVFVKHGQGGICNEGIIEKI